MFSHTDTPIVGGMNTPVDIVKKELSNKGGYGPEEVVVKLFHVWSHVYTSISEDESNDLNMGTLKSYKLYIQYDDRINTSLYVRFQGEDELYNIKKVENKKNKVSMDVYIEGVIS